jgi:hypothetical protein
MLVENCKMVAAGAGFHPEQDFTGRGRANAALLILDARLNLLRYRPT